MSLAEKISMWGKPNKSLNCNKGLREQIDECKKSDYDKFDLDTLVDYCIELSKPKKRFEIFTGKPGVLNYMKSLYKEIGLKEHSIRVRLAKDNLDLKDGLYQIGELGIKYYGLQEI